MKKLLIIFFVFISFFSNGQYRLIFEDAVENYKAGNYERAEERFTQAIQENMYDQNAYLNRGNCRFKLGRYEDAIKDYNTYLKMIPNYDLPYEIIGEASNAYYMLGLSYVAVNNSKEAIYAFRRSVETNPPSLPALFELANVKFDSGDFEGAIRNLTTYLEFMPNSAEAYNNRGMAKAKIGKPKEAVEDFDAAIRNDSTNADLYYNRGFEKFLMHKDKEALEDFSKVIALKPNYLNALYYRGKIYYNLDEYEKAADDLEKVVKLNPGDVKAKDALFAARFTCYLSKYWLYLVLILVFTISAIVCLVKVLKGSGRNNFAAE